MAFEDSDPLLKTHGVASKAPAKKSGLLGSIASLLGSKQPETIEELEKKIEPTEEIERAVEEASKASEATPGKKTLFSLIGSVIPEEITFDLFTDGPFSAEYPDWPRLKELPENCVVAVTNGVFTVEISVEEMEPLTFATYMKKIILGVEEQLNAKILQKRVLLDSAYLEFILVRDNKLWLYKAKIVECNRRFYTASINGPKKEFQAMKAVFDRVLAAVTVYKAGKPYNVSLEDMRDLSTLERDSLEHQMHELEEEIAESEVRAGFTMQAKATPLEELIPIGPANASKPRKAKAVAAPPSLAAGSPTPKPAVVQLQAIQKQWPRKKQASTEPVSKDHSLVEELLNEPAPFKPSALESPALKRLEAELTYLQALPATSPPAKPVVKPVPTQRPVLKPVKTAKPAPTVAPVALAATEAKPLAPALPPKPEAPSAMEKPKLPAGERAKLERKLTLLDEALALGVISAKSYKAGRAELRALLGE